MILKRSEWRRSIAAVLALALFPAVALSAEGEVEKIEPQALVASICSLIETHAGKQGLEAPFLARLLWKESRFNPNAVSPKGAEGVAQFMPGTASLRGLQDAFDIEQAIPAAAAYLSELERKFGNLGLAAAAYNAGENRIARWLGAGGFLPLETENYVLSIFGEPVDNFSDREHRPRIAPLDADKSFKEACQQLPVTARAVIAMASVPSQPWGVQVAGHFRRDVAIRLWQQAKRRNAALLAGHEPVVSRVRSPRGWRGIYAVRIGAKSREEAGRLCERLYKGGVPCIVQRNR
ncbi:lytic transglycosylase domain-containing protein [Nitratireductor indicus]|uniref:lytic transglycosylase domain-containing protein n=1 Tax=Nitratireductor indicus TaxID=721133 RepID=UPI002876B3DC|nr:lytic transglycosylase domain-containing protein [Nitratireductor indicus]MDS1136845.1 lytic transglycosylase domain-containing protein [Nitratireductor indicus]